MFSHYRAVPSTHVLHHIRPVLSESMVATLGTSLVQWWLQSRLDYANFIMYGMSASNTKYTLPRIRYLHWLPVHYRIQFKIATLTYKTLATCQPSYLYNLIQLHQPSRALCSSTQQLLQVPYMSTNFGWHTFSYSSPATWNSIPTSIKSCLCL